jgi:hypothetical protein
MSSIILRIMGQTLNENQGGISVIVLAFECEKALP